MQREAGPHGSSSTRCPWSFLLLVGLIATACAPAAAPPAPAQPAPAPPAAPAVAPPAASAAAPPAVRPLDPPVTVKLSYVQLVGEAGIFVGMDRGYFTEEGIEVALEKILTPVERTAALSSGEMHFGSAGLDASLFNAAQRDIPIKVVDGEAVTRPDERSVAVTVRKDLIDSGRYRDVADLKGMTIARNSVPSTGQFHVERALAKVGLTLNDVEFTVVPFPDMLPALANRAVDAGFQVEPLLTVSELQGISQRAVLLADIYPGSVSAVLTISPVFAREQPEAARRFFTAYLRGQRDYWRAIWMNEGSKDDLVEIVVKYTTLKDRALVNRMALHGVQPNGGLDERFFDEVQDYFVRAGALSQKVDVSQVVDRSYLDYALQRLGRVAE